MFQRVLVLLTTISLICSPCWADTEYIFPTSDDSGWDTGTFDDYNSAHLVDDDTGFTAEATKNVNMTGAMSDLLTADADDTYNFVKIHCRSMLTPTVGNEFVRCSILDGVDTSDFDGSSNAAFATDISGELTVHNSFAEINALTYILRTLFSGAESVGDWRVSEFHVEVDYTPVVGGTRRIFQSGKLFKIIDWFIKTAHAEAR